MQALEKIRLSDAQEAMLEAGELIRIPASWEEFEEFLTETNHRVEYHDGHIVIVGLAIIIHELLVSWINYILTGFFPGKPYYVLGSNAGIREDGKKGHYNGDVLVVKGQPVYQGKSRSIITNPYLIVEILSKSTLNYDLGAKRQQYEKMDTVNELIFVNTFDREVVVCRRTDQANAGLETTYSKPEDQVSIDEYQVRLGDVFANLPEEE
ncbi:Uma2 family endonuclease [Spirosoma fluminis]